MEPPETSSSDATPDTLWDEPPGLGRMVATTSVIAAIVFFLATAIGMRLNGQSWATAVGLGLFVAFWGGLGFGGMSGGVRHALRLEAEEAAAHHAKHLVSPSARISTPDPETPETQTATVDEPSESDAENIKVP